MAEKWNKLVEWRRARKWSQQTLAMKLGVSVGTIHRWESGRFKASPLAWVELQRLGFKDG